MEIRHLQAFAAVVKHGTFQRAAREIHSSQSTLSKSVRQLEFDLGVQLLDRGGRTNLLTDAGEVVYRRTLGILSQISDLRGELSELSGLKAGQLRIGLPSLATGPIFAKTLSRFHKRYPNIRIELKEESSSHLRELLRAGEIEMAAYMTGPLDREFESAAVTRQQFCLIVAATNRLAGRLKIELSKAKAQRFILFDNSYAVTSVVLDACKRQGFVPEVVAQSKQVDFIADLVAADVGVAVLPQIIAADLSNRRISTMELADSRMEWRISLVWRRGGYLSPAARQWRAMLLEDAKSLR
jgi:DNA-binding transcriptional LysR family regulator